MAESGKVGRSNAVVRTAASRDADNRDLEPWALAVLDCVQTALDDPPLELTGDRARRIECHVDAHARTCETWLSLWRNVLGLQPRTEAMQTGIERVRAVALDRLRRVYRPELDGLAAQRRQRLLIMLEGVTEFEYWGRMREHHGLSFDDACSAWREAIDRLLPAASRDTHQDIRRSGTMTRSEITRDELLRTVSANVGMLRVIVETTRRLHEKAALQQIIDAYDMYADARRLDKETVDSA
jgi:hypothetical protein